MTVVPVKFDYRKTGPARAVFSGLARGRVTILLFAAGFPVVFYLLLLGVLVIKYGHLPNYFTRHAWLENVLRIIHATPSVTDMVPIILNEWLLEIGYINYQYGHGVAEWSLSIIPHKLAIMSLAGALIGLNVVLLTEQQTAWSLPQQCVRTCQTSFLTSLGALFTGMTNATVFSVACCSVPSWAGSLTILGVDTSLAFSLEPFGGIASAAGLLALAISALWIARDSRGAPGAPPLASQHGAVPC